MDLESLEYRELFPTVSNSILENSQTKVSARELQEALFRMPVEGRTILRDYMAGVWWLRWLAPNGIQWRLTSSGADWIYDTRRRTVIEGPGIASLTISIPDLVLFEALEHGNVADIGNSMFCRIDTQVESRRAYLCLALMAMHDAGHFSSMARFLKLSWATSREFAPRCWSIWWRWQSRKAAIQFRRSSS